MSDSEALIETFAMYGSHAGSARVRIHDWLRHLDIPAVSHSYIGSRHLSVADLVGNPVRTAAAELSVRSLGNPAASLPSIVSRGVSPFDRGRLVRRVNSRSAHSAYDFDDAIMVDPPGWKKVVKPQAKVWRSAVQSADTVIAGNSYLADIAGSYNRNTVVIPSCIEPGAYRKKTDYSIKDHPVAVWIGSPSTEVYLSLLSEAFNSLHEQIGLTLLIISAGNAPIPGINPAMVERRAWSLATFADDLWSADFGIMPLEDTEWERGKCAYKLLQYAATGLVAVASPVGANKSVLSTISGIPASTNDEWVDAISSVARMSVSDRSAIGDSAFAGVVREYSFASWSSVWLRAVGLEL